MEFRGKNRLINLPFNQVQRLLAARRVDVYWRGGPQSGIGQALFSFLPDIRIEPYSLFISAGPLWSMGAFSYSQSSLPPEMIVGRYTSISNAVTVFHSEHPTSWISTSPFAYNPAAAPLFGQALADAGAEPAIHPFDDMSSAPILIGNDVWIGQNVMLKRGIFIGDGAVVASGAVVTRDVEPFSIVGGVPAKLIRKRFDDALIRRIMALKWWRYHPKDIQDLRVPEPTAFLDGLERKIAAGLKPYEPEAVTIDAIQDHLRGMAGGGT